MKKLLISLVAILSIYVYLGSTPGRTLVPTKDRVKQKERLAANLREFSRGDQSKLVIKSEKERDFKEWDKQIEIKEQDFIFIQNALEGRSQLNQINSEQMTPLLLAIESGNQELVKKLLLKGADPHIAPNGSFPLLMASEQDLLEVVELILKKGVSPDFTFNNVNYKLLMEAAFENNFELVSLLLKYGANPLEKDDSGKTALDYADREKNYQTIPILLKSIEAIDTEYFKNVIRKLDQKCLNDLSFYCEKIRSII